MVRPEVTGQGLFAGPDELVPDPQVRREFGGVSSMTTWRWDRDPKMVALGWPPPIKIQGRNFRSRTRLEAFKGRLVQRALDSRGAVMAE
jgi:hypothetical protein